MLRISSVLFTAALCACGASEPEPASSLPELEVPSSKGGTASKGPAPVLKGPNVMTRGGRGSVGGQAELLAACIGENQTPGAATLELTVEAGAVKTAKVSDGGGTDEAFTSCLEKRSVGMPYEGDGAATLTLTAM
ncbi:MAG: hypothetical protein KC912_15455 [Proteobacteria bacterium]|nr:hypothetical protein [Pseudomonadota bacterium]